MARFCPECGAAAEGAKFCPECGTALNGQTAAAPQPAQVEPMEEDEREIWSGKPDSALAPIGERSQRYVLTTDRLKVDSGMLRKKSESLDLWRVKDVSVKKSITQRTRGCGDVVITSADASTPELTLAWIKNADDVAEQIRQISREARKRHGVVTQERY